MTRPKIIELSDELHLLLFARAEEDQTVVLVQPLPGPWPYCQRLVEMTPEVASALAGVLTNHLAPAGPDDDAEEA